MARSSKTRTDQTPDAEYIPARNGELMRSVPLLKILVHDLDDALAFYTDVLDLAIREDRTLGDYRWLLVGFPAQADFALNLDLATTEEQRQMVGRQAADLPLFSIDTDDCESDYQRLRARGVNFESEPDAQPYGTGVMLRDLYNNRIYLNQEPTAI